MDRIEGASPRVVTRSTLAPHDVPSLRTLLSRSTADVAVAAPSVLAMTQSGNMSNPFGSELPSLEPTFMAYQPHLRRRLNPPAPSVLETLSSSPAPDRAAFVQRAYQRQRPSVTAELPQPAIPTRQNPYRTARPCRRRSNNPFHTSRTTPAMFVASLQRPTAHAVMTHPQHMPEVAPTTRSRSKKRRATKSEDSPSPRKKTRLSVEKQPPPNAKKPPTVKTESDDDEDKKPSGEGDISCCICMSEPTRDELSKIDGCEHRFCFVCIGKWADRENTCPLCKTRFSKIERVHRQRGKKGVSNTKRVKQRDQRADLVAGPALEGLIASIAANGQIPGGARLGRFIFSRMGTGGVFPMSAARHGSGATRVTFSLDDNLVGGDSDDDDDDFPGANFMNVFMRSTLHSVAASRVQAQQRRTHPFVAMVPPVAPAQPPARSYATNGNDQSAGRATNPLEIDDSDDDDDVEVVQVTRST